jgi:hypothetical protein
MVVLYGFETWSHTLWEECRLRIFENRVLRRVFWPKRDELTGEWRRLHNKELYNLREYYSGYQIQKIYMGRTCSTYGGEERSIQSFGGET